MNRSALLVALCPVLACVLACGGAGNKTKKREAPAAVQVAADKPAPASRKWESPGNPFAADEFPGHYDTFDNGKLCAVWGWIKHMDDDKVVLWFKDGPRVTCKIRPGERWKLAHLREGVQLAVHGRIASFDELTECVILHKGSVERRRYFDVSETHQTNYEDERLITKDSPP